jgi:HSP20 family protein
MKLLPKKYTSNGSDNLPLRDVMNRLFDESFLSPMGRDLFSDSFFSGTAFAASVPKVDITEEEKHFRITADVPGYSADDMEIELNGNTLSLKGKKEEDKEEKEKTYHLRERTHAQWERSFTLPITADTEKITCEVKNGTLHVTIPKTAEGTSRKLKIDSK